MPDIRCTDGTDIGRKAVGSYLSHFDIVAMGPVTTGLVAAAFWPRVAGNLIEFVAAPSPEVTFAIR